MFARTFLVNAAALMLAVFASNANAYRYYGGGYDYAQDEVEVLDEVVCESIKKRTSYCPIDTRSGQVMITDQYSRSACIEGETWGVDRRGVWVTDGCRGSFATVRPIPRGRGRQPGYGQGYDDGYDEVQIITCESRDQQQNYCAIPRGARVRLHDQLSRAQCSEGYSWGYDRRGIWVSKGCRAEFEVY
jgi:Protein of unknown function (DUF3011)